MASESWIQMTIGDVCLGLFDGPHATPKKTDSGPIFLGISSLVNGRLDLSDTEHLNEEDYIKWTRRVTPQPDDVVFSYETRLGEAARIPSGFRCCLGRRMARMRPNPKKIDPRFLLYLYLSPTFQKLIRSRTVHGSTVDRIPLLDFLKFPITIPLLNEQKAIAHILGTLDDKIELNRRMNETLEAMARAIFKSWFVDFDPVRAKMDGRHPFGMDSATAALFPDRFVESALGCTPQGWKIRQLSEVIEVNPKRTLSKGTISPYLDMKNMPTRGHCPNEIIDRAFSSGTKFSNDDTLLARITPCLENGKTAFVDFLCDGEVGWGSTEYIVFHPKTPLPAEFGYYLARSDDLRSFAIQNMTGTSGRQRVPPDCFNQYLLAIPPEAIVRRFGDFVRPFIKQISANVEQSKHLAAIRDALLPKLLSGDICVSAVKRMGKEMEL